MATFEERLQRARVKTTASTIPTTPTGGSSVGNFLKGLLSKVSTGLGPAASLISYAKRPLGVTDITDQKRIAPGATGTPERELIDLLSPYFRGSEDLTAKERLGRTLTGELKGLGEIGLNIAEFAKPAAKALERKGIFFKPGQAEFPTQLRQQMREAMPMTTGEEKIGEQIGRTLPTMALWTTGARTIETPLATKLAKMKSLGKLAKPLAWAAYRAGGTPIIQPLISEGTVKERLKKIPMGVAGDLAVSALLSKLGFGQEEWRGILREAGQDVISEKQARKLLPKAWTKLESSQPEAFSKILELTRKLGDKPDLGSVQALSHGANVDEVLKALGEGEGAVRALDTALEKKKAAAGGYGEGEMAKKFKAEVEEVPALEKAAKEGVPGESELGKLFREYVDRGDVEEARGLVEQFPDYSAEKKSFQRLLDMMVEGEEPRTTIPTVAIQQRFKEAGLNGSEMVEATKKVSAGVEPEKAIADTKYAFNINKNRMNLDDSGRKQLDEAVGIIKKELETQKGPPLTESEILADVEKYDILKRATSREDTKKLAASLTRLRQAVAAGAAEEKITPEYLENVRVLSSWATRQGRLLKAFDIEANPVKVSVKTEMVSDLLKIGKDADEILKAAEGVDFDNPAQVTNFYRKFVPASFLDKINEYRYINMLSSPKTHLINAASNISQAGVLDPAAKLYSGTIDWIQSGLTGKKRTHYVSEVPAYYKGVFNSLGEAASSFADALKGQRFIERPDVARLPTGAKLLKPLKIIPQALEASDVFFRTLIKGGEVEALSHRAVKQGVEVPLEKIEKEAGEKAAYYVFRNALDPQNKTGQGTILSLIDWFTSGIYNMRRKIEIGGKEIPNPIAWLAPFVQTPMNILKQGIEYSPVGAATMIGAKDPTEQLAKSLLGSTVMAGAAWLAAKGDTTWAAPKGEKDKELFYASGRKPYSIKLGDKWYGYSKIGPLAYPIAMAAAAKQYYGDDPNVFVNTEYEKALNMGMSVVKFFSDQSYVQGMGDIIKAALNEPGSIEKVLTSPVRQLIPLVALQGWVARFIDPYYRKAETPWEAIKAGIPDIWPLTYISSKTLEPYTTPVGTPSERNRWVELLSPVQIGEEAPEYEPLYQFRKSKKQIDAIGRALKNVENAKELERLLKRLNLEKLLE